VLVVGVGFGVAQVQPVPAIILAQALNGIILPVVAIYLLLMVNSAATLGPDQINSPAHNVLMGLVVFVTIVLGTTNVLEVLNRLVAAPVAGATILWTSVGAALLLAWPIGRSVTRLRDRSAAPTLLDED
jgi:hypothetical protein